MFRFGQKVKPHVFVILCTQMVTVGDNETDLHLKFVTTIMHRLVTKSQLMTYHAMPRKNGGYGKVASTHPHKAINCLNSICYSSLN